MKVLVYVVLCLLVIESCINNNAMGAKCTFLNKRANVCGSERKMKRETASKFVIRDNADLRNDEMPQELTARLLPHEEHIGSIVRIKAKDNEGLAAPDWT